MMVEATIKAFVEASISAEEFERSIQSDASFERLLKNEVRLPAYIQEADLYTHLISQDYSRIGSVYNVQQLLCSFLKKHEIAHICSEKYGELFELTLKVQPKWLDLPAWYFSRAIDGEGASKGKALVGMLKKKIAQDFRFLKAAPKWLQSPDWPFVEGRPLVFVGQIDIGSLRHDTAQLYIFYDEHTGTFVTSSQSC
ncbi:hypothetical protein FHT08_003555 [Xanthomonas campestris]|uniref:Uncharacterized protein n=2 Tax=Xanthomonas arboricola TaxID=56448 RepID=A0A2S7AF51_9XANT|nr:MULTISPECIES: hypothetical protein [Xanthomonas]NIJ78421.1 hypothetical protein [Xanthomonas sp. CFBP 8151]PPT73383.1 hypothetical protein XarbCFBP8152_20670 [Xanthomonas arboricola]PPU08211.1 hypothetical protein XarjCFBP7645_11840 [Xanthomonas arboricola]